MKAARRTRARKRAGTRPAGHGRSRPLGGALDTGASDAAGIAADQFVVNGRVQDGAKKPVRLLAGEDARRIDLSGDWWACWQSWKDSVEVINPHQITMSQRGDVLAVSAVTRGTPLEGGGYLWDGELRLWDNEILMGWYVANEGAVRSKGTMFFTLHQHGERMTGRWVGLSYDGPIITGWGSIARTEAEAVALMNELRDPGGITE